MAASFSAASEHLLRTAAAPPLPTVATPRPLLARLRLTLRMLVGSSAVRRPGRMEIACSNYGEGSPGITYKVAGVDIDVGTELVRRIAKMVSGIGG